MKLLDAARRALLWQFIRFAIVGTGGFLVDIGVLTFCTQALGMGPYLGRLFSFLTAATFGWFCNRHFTFKGQGGGHPGAQWARFLAVSAGGFVFNYGTYAALISTIPFAREHLVIGVAAGSIAGMFFNFFASRHFVFR